jgi:hypothetical protein
MNKNLLMAIPFLLTLGAADTAYAQAPALEAGTYKLAIGSKAPCDVSISADGALTPAADCTLTANVTKLVPRGEGYVLTYASGDLYGQLRPKGDAFEGATFGDQHKLVLSH